MFRFGFLVLVCLFLSPATATAQLWHKETKGPVFCGENVDISPECQKEFDNWLKKEMKWRRVHATWANYALWKGEKTPIAGKAGLRPVMPWWLESHCRPERDFSLSLKSRVCGEYEAAVDYDWAMHVTGPRSVIIFTNTVSVGVAENNKVLEFLFQNAHFDPLWTNGSNGPRIWGMIGGHMTIAHVGRVYLWGSPGIIVMKFPDGKIETRLTYGMDIKLTYMPLPLRKNRLAIYLTMAKAMTHTEAAMGRGFQGGLDMVGLSVTWK